MGKLPANCSSFVAAKVLLLSRAAFCVLDVLSAVTPLVLYSLMPSPLLITPRISGRQHLMKLDTVSHSSKQGQYL